MQKKTNYWKKCQCKEGIDSKDLEFDLRLLGFDKLKVFSNGSRCVYYKDARKYLCRLFHMDKLQGRRLLLEMSRIGLVSFDMRGKLWLKGQKASPISCERL